MGGDGEVWIWPVLLSMLALACLFGIFYYIRRARLIEDVPTSKIRSAAQGYLELIGQCALPDNEMLVAPLTGSPCVWYRFRIERRETVRINNRTRTHWRRVDAGESQTAFLLKDATGHCLVNPQGAEIFPAITRTWYGHSAWPQVGTKTRRGILSGIGRDYRYTEARFIADFPIYALGDFITLSEDNGESSIKRQVVETLRNWKTKPQALLHHFDADHNGQIDMQEWERVRQAARQKVIREQLSQPPKEAVHTLGKPRDNRPFILSSKSQREMSREYRVKAAACVVGFVLAGPGAIWMLVKILNAG